MFANLASQLDALSWADLAVLVLRLTVLSAAGLMVLAALPRATAALRHQIALVSLGALLAIPVAAALLPALPLPVLPARSSAIATAARSATVEPRPEASDVRVGPPSPMTLGRYDGVGIERVSDRTESRSLPVPRPGAVVIAVLIGAGVLLARWLRSILIASRLARAAALVTDERLCRELEHAKRRLGLTGDVALRSTERLRVPIVWGVRRPTLLLPAEAHDWSPERQRIVLFHELGHVVRHDALSLMIARFATAVFWFHPLAWALAHRMRRECEQACDDVVLATGERPSAYAEHLLAIARRAFAHDALGDVAPAFARRSKLEHRLMAILDPDVERRPMPARALAGIAIAAVLIALPVATARVVAAPAKAAPTLAALASDGVAMESRVGYEKKRSYKKSTRTEERTTFSTESQLTTALATSEARIELAGSNKGEQLFEEAREHYREDRYNEAAEAYIRAAAAGYRAATALYNAACSLALEGRKDDAIVALEQALEAGFDSPELIAGDDDLDSLRSDPRFRKLADRSRTADRGEQRVRAATRKYEMLRGKQSKDSDDWRDTGLSLMRLGEYAPAIDAFQREYEISSDADALYNAACAMALSGDRKAGIAMLERAILAGSSSPDHIRRDSDLRALRSDSRFRELVDLAKDLQLRGDVSAMGMNWGWDAAIPHYERVVRERPEVGRAWFNLGFVQLRSDDSESAARSFRKSLELKHRPQTSMYNLACAYAQMREPDEAIGWLERAEAAGMEVGKLALGDDDLDPLRSDPRFRRMRDRWQRGMDEKRND